MGIFEVRLNAFEIVMSLWDRNIQEREMYGLKVMNLGVRLTRIEMMANLGGI